MRCTLPCGDRVKAHQLCEVIFSTCIQFSPVSMVILMSVFVGGAATVVTGADSSQGQQTTATFLLR